MNGDKKVWKVYQYLNILINHNLGYAGINYNSSNVAAYWSLNEIQVFISL